MLGESYHVPSPASVKQMADIRKPCTRSSVYVYEYVIEINEAFRLSSLPPPRTFVKYIRCDKKRKAWPGVVFGTLHQVAKTRACMYYKLYCMPPRLINIPELWSETEQPPGPTCYMLVSYK